MIGAILGQKKNQTQKFLTDGKRIPVTQVVVADNAIVSIKTQARDGYRAVQIGYAAKRKPSKALLGHIKGAKLEKAPLFMREIRVIDANIDELPKQGEFIKVAEVLQPGDIIQVTGTSKGKGFAGGVKRYHFRGGPKTHGQSDRHRAPGSIGSGTTPGRVYKGKRMAGKMGNDTVTVKNLEVIAVDDENVYIKGLVPGVRKGFLVIKKIGENKNFVGLLEEIKPALKVEETKESLNDASVTEESANKTVIDEKEENGSKKGE